MTENQDNDKQLQIASIVNLTVSSISIFSGLLVLFAYLKFKEFQTFSLKLFCLMIFSDLLQSIAWFFNPQTLNGEMIQNNWRCQTSSFLLQFGQLSSVFWSIMISHAIFSAIVKGHIDQSSQLKRYLFITYGFSLVISSIPFSIKSYGPVEYFCWITIDKENEIASNQIRMCLFYLPIWILFLIQTLYFYKVDNFEKRIAHGNNLKHKTHRKFISYSIIFLATWIPPTILRSLNVIGIPSQDVFPLACLAIVTSRLHGFVFTLLYLFNRKIIKVLQNLVCYKRQNNRQESQNSNNGIEMQDTSKKSQKAIYKSTDETQLNNFKTRQKSPTQIEMKQDNKNNQESEEYDNIRDRDLSFLSIEM